MQNPTGRGEITPEDAIAEVKKTEELILRCTLPTGQRVDHKRLDLSGVDGNMWVSYYEEYGLGRTENIVGVRNMAKRCDPDIELLHESKHLLNHSQTGGRDE